MQIKMCCAVKLLLCNIFCNGERLLWMMDNKDMVHGKLLIFLIESSCFLKNEIEFTGWEQTTRANLSVSVFMFHTSLLSDLSKMVNVIIGLLIKLPL